MLFRKASTADVSAVEEIYNDIHTEEEKGKLTIGWIRGIYPTRATAEGALKRGKLFVLEDEGRVVGAGIINQDQAEAYARKTGCKACRMDTLEWNSVARAMYGKLGYAEVGIVSTELQGLANVSMVLLEKYLG